MSDVPIFFSGEVQFRRYSDTSTQGQQIVFALEDREALAPFIGAEGARFQAVLVRIGDDEQPVPVQRKDTRGPLCREACDYCAMPEFQRWVSTRIKGDCDEETAKHWLMRQCLGIESRKELDHDADAAQLFIKCIRIPFMRWQRERKQEAVDAR